MISHIFSPYPVNLHYMILLMLQAPEQWPAIEKSIQQRYELLNRNFVNDGKFKILGYQWRVLRFNDNTRQSTAKVMATYSKSDPASIYLMQQPHCLAVPCNFLCSLSLVSLLSVKSGLICLCMSLLSLGF